MNEVLDSFAISDRLGLKSPWRLLDFAKQENETCWKGFKYFTVNELFFCGHFPKHPIVPGVLQLESVRQLCTLFAPSNTKWAISNLDKVKFRRPVVPGDRMQVDVELISSADDKLSFKCTTSTVSGVCSEALMSFAPQKEFAAPVSFPAVGGEFERTDEVFMDTDKVLKLMPHRYPFLLIDYIARATDVSVTAMKNVTGNEPFFESGFSVIPEVLLCEIAAQAGCASVLSRPENAGKLGFFMAIDKAVFYRQIRPGEQIRFESDLPPSKSRFGKGSGKMYVGDELVFETTLMFAIVDA